MNYIFSRPNLIFQKQIEYSFRGARPIYGATVIVAYVTQSRQASVLQNDLSLADAKHLKSINLATF
jgi:hypothetical protein